MVKKDTAEDFVMMQMQLEMVLEVNLAIKISKLPTLNQKMPKDIKNSWKYNFLIERNESILRAKQIYELYFIIQAYPRLNFTEKDL